MSARSEGAIYHGFCDPSERKWAAWGHFGSGRAPKCPWTSAAQDVPTNVPHKTGWASVRVRCTPSDQGLSGGGDRDRTGYLLHAMHFLGCSCYIILSGFVG